MHVTLMLCPPLVKDQRPLFSVQKGSLSKGVLEDLTRQVQQLQLQSREDNHQKDEVIRQKVEEIERLQGQLQATSRDSEQVVATFQQSVEEKDRTLRAKDVLLQEEERQIQELQQSLGRRDVATGPLKLEWRDGPRAPFATYGESVAVSGDMAYFCDGVRDTKVLMYNSKTGQWTVLPECSNTFFSIAVVNGMLTAIGGEHSGIATKTLLSLTHRQNRLGTSQQKWIEQFPPRKWN